MVVHVKTLKDKERTEAVKGLFEMFNLNLSSISYPKSYDNKPRVQLVGGSASLSPTEDKGVEAAKGLMKMFGLK